jgi:hypothetical protein
MLGYPSDSTYEPPSTRAISKWRSALSPSEVALAESRIGPMLVERGYALSGAATSTPLPLAEAAATPLPLQLDDWWYRLNFRRKRYGTALLLGDIISRRLPIGPLRRAVRDRVERIDRSFLK